MSGASPRARSFFRAALACVAALALAQFSGCARQHGARAAHDDDTTSPDDETTRDRPDGDQDAGVSEPSISALLSDVFAAYQRDNHTRCPCQVELGVYASLDECEEITARTSPRIDECLDRAVPPDLEPPLRAWMRCLLVAVEDHHACVEEASCEEQPNCRLDSARCAFPDPVALSSALSKCPHAISSQL